MKEKIAEVSKGLPHGVRVVPFYDRSALIARAVGTLKRALIEEILLVTLAHILFLLHFRSILIVTLPLPLAILTSFILMTSSASRRTSCRSSESPSPSACSSTPASSSRRTSSVTSRRTAEEAHFEIVRDAARQIGRPIFFSMVIILLAFLPVFSLTGEEGKLFHPLAFTKTFA